MCLAGRGSLLAPPGRRQGREELDREPRGAMAFRRGGRQRTEALQGLS